MGLLQELLEGLLAKATYSQLLPTQAKGLRRIEQLLHSQAKGLRKITQALLTHPKALGKVAQRLLSQVSSMRLCHRRLQSSLSCERATLQLLLSHPFFDADSPQRLSSLPNVKPGVLQSLCDQAQPLRLSQQRLLEDKLH